MLTLAGSISSVDAALQPVSSDSGGESHISGALGLKVQTADIDFAIELDKNVKGYLHMPGGFGFCCLKEGMSAEDGLDACSSDATDCHFSVAHSGCRPYMHRMHYPGELQCGVYLSDLKKFCDDNPTCGGAFCPADAATDVKAAMMTFERAKRKANGKTVHLDEDDEPIARAENDRLCTPRSVEEMALDSGKFDSTHVGAAVQKNTNAHIYTFFSNTPPFATGLSFVETGKKGMTARVIDKNPELKEATYATIGKYVAEESESLFWRTYATQNKYVEVSTSFLKVKGLNVEEGFCDFPEPKMNPPTSNVEFPFVPVFLSKKMKKKDWTADSNVGTVGMCPPDFPVCDVKHGASTCVTLASKKNLCDIYPGQYGSLFDGSKWAKLDANEPVLSKVAKLRNPQYPGFNCLSSHTASKPFSVHGDPMFKHNGTGTHFWIKEDVLTPMLVWTSANGNKMKMFKQIVVSQDGEDVFDASALDTNQFEAAMKILLDGKPMSAKTPKGAVKLHQSVKGPKVSVSHRKRKDSMTVEAGGVSFDVAASRAAKFAHKASQNKYNHLNIKFHSGIPGGSKGIFAELAGVQPMSAFTKEMLAPPHFNRVARQRQAE